MSISNLSKNLKAFSNYRPLSAFSPLLMQSLYLKTADP
uniref:Uncharacterized protein n=1 Tax=Rhizophora mucronata TaxID=61149 RepID=A0A2P2L589_RHIMU